MCNGLHIKATILNYLVRFTIEFPFILVSDRLWFAQRLFQAGGGDDSKLETRVSDFSDE